MRSQSTQGLKGTHRMGGRDRSGTALDRSFQTVGLVPILQPAALRLYRLLKGNHKGCRAYIEVGMFFPNPLCHVLQINGRAVRLRKDDVNRLMDGVIIDE
jgi:hypothetical protein